MLDVIRGIRFPIVWREIREFEVSRAHLSKDLGGVGRGMFFYDPVCITGQASFTQVTHLITKIVNHGDDVEASVGGHSLFRRSHPSPFVRPLSRARVPIDWGRRVVTLTSAQPLPEVFATVVPLGGKSISKIRPGGMGA